jgi:hypothetical protein
MKVRLHEQVTSPSGGCCLCFQFRDSPERYNVGFGSTSVDSFSMFVFRDRIKYHSNLSWVNVRIEVGFCGFVSNSVEVNLL